jgi:N-acetylmuramoyl-L-alanine amidase
VVIDLERKVKLTYDRIASPDRLWIDLEGTRLHPNLRARSFPVGDGLLEQIRIAQNKDDVVRVVLDFKDVKDHSVFYLDPTRLVIDVKGQPRPRSAVASAASPSPSPADAPPADRTADAASDKPAEKAADPPAAPDKPSEKVAEKAPEKTPVVDTIPTRRVDGMLPPEPAPVPLPVRTPAPIAVAGLARPEPEIAPKSTRDAAARRKSPGAPEPPDVNRAGSYSLARQLGLGARRIVIDAGHGGHDPGTIGRGGLQEKDLVLDVATRLEKMVRSELGAEVIMTRTADTYVPLEERTAIANSKEADLFLSVHANASRNPTARGIETYFLNFAQDPHAEAVAARENAISAATLKDLQGLVKAITLNSKIDESRDFATSVQEAMVEYQRPHHPVEDRGVHTAPFYVLIGANMPSVLAEIAFVTNPDDEKLLKASDTRELIARSLLRGVRAYLESLSRTQTRQLTGSHGRSTVAVGESGR